MLAAIAARTERIRLGTSIFLLPLSHPLEVAEQVASLDALSNDRVIFGPGLGYRTYEYDAVGLPYHTPRSPHVGVHRDRARRVGERVVLSTHGEFYTFDDVTLTPRPVQQPAHPYLGGRQQ